MGREIRCVIPNWEHPKQDCKHSPWQGGCTQARANGGKCYMPLHDRSYADAVKEWKDGFAEWEKSERAKHKERHGDDCEYWEWHGPPPSPEDYRPEWKEDAATWFQVYETVSEGTPISPPFATKEDLVNFLCTQKDFWGQGPRTKAQAEAFVKDEWVPSMAIAGGAIYNDMEISSMPKQTAA